MNTTSFGDWKHLQSFRCIIVKEMFSLCTNGFKDEDLLLSHRQCWKQSFVVYFVAIGSLLKQRSQEGRLGTKWLLRSHSFTVVLWINFAKFPDPSKTFPPLVGLPQVRQPAHSAALFWVRSHCEQSIVNDQLYLPRESYSVPYADISQGLKYAFVPVSFPALLTSTLRAEMLP